MKNQAQTSPGLLTYEVIQGPDTLHRNYFDEDAFDEDFLNAEGKKMKKNVKKGILRGAVQNIRARKDLKAQSKANLRNAKAQAKVSKAQAAKTTAQANVAAAKGLSKGAGVGGGVSAKTISVPEKSNTMKYVLIGGGVLLVLGVTAYFLLKKKKK